MKILLALRYVDLYAHGDGVSRDVAERDIVLNTSLVISLKIRISTVLHSKRRTLEKSGVNHLHVIWIIAMNGFQAHSSLR